MATVLVVDDECGIAELLVAVLADANHRVLTASNGSHGLDVLSEEKADVIFLDYMMPVMHGAAMLAQLIASPAWRDTPVVMMSAMPETFVAERCAGYVRFLRKPFTVSRILDVVNDLTANAGPSGSADGDA